MLPDILDRKSANFYADVISLIFWVVVLGIVIYMKMALFIFSLLFTFFVFRLIHLLLKKMGLNFKLLSSLVSLSLLSVLFYLAYEGFSYMLSDVSSFMDESEKLFQRSLIEYGFSEEMVKKIDDWYSNLGLYAVENLEVLKNAGSALLKALLGIIFGIIIFHTKIERENNEENLWKMSLNKIYTFSEMVFSAFKGIMTTQIIISLLNTVFITIFSLGFTYLYTGEFLPYWYILIPFVTVFSLIPVVGNLMVNVLIALSALQVSVYYIVVAIVYFFIVHKMELLVIGKFLNLRMHAPFIIILFSMILGELLFASVVGVIMGMTMLFVVLALLSSYKIRVEEKKVVQNR